MEILLIDIFDKPHGIIIFQLLAATRFTIYLSLVAFSGGGIVASMITFLTISHRPMVRKFAQAYIWFLQSIPLLMLFFLTGLGVPRLLGLDVNPWTAASISLVLFTSAYLAEVWRGAIAAVPSGQWEAGFALNIGFVSTLKKIILPQAIRYGLAPTVGFLVQIIKGTSLAYIIDFSDLMLTGKRWANAPVLGSEPFIIFPLMAVIYFCICYPLAMLARRLEAEDLAKI